jgi:hypothetical protein
MIIAVSQVRVMATSTNDCEKTAQVRTGFEDAGEVFEAASGGEQSIVVQMMGDLKTHG